MVKRIAFALALAGALAACTSPTAPVAPHDSHVSGSPMSAAGTLIGSDT